MLAVASRTKDMGMEGRAIKSSSSHGDLKPKPVRTTLLHDYTKERAVEGSETILRKIPSTGSLKTSVKPVLSEKTRRRRERRSRSPHKNASTRGGLSAFLQDGTRPSDEEFWSADDLSVAGSHHSVRSEPNLFQTARAPVFHVNFALRRTGSNRSLVASIPSDSAAAGMDSNARLLKSLSNPRLTDTRHNSSTDLRTLRRNRSQQQVLKTHSARSLVLGELPTTKRNSKTLKEGSNRGSTKELMAAALLEASEHDHTRRQFSKKTETTDRKHRHPAKVSALGDMNDSSVNNDRSRRTATRALSSRDLRKETNANNKNRWGIIPRSYSDPMMDDSSRRCAARNDNDAMTDASMMSISSRTHNIRKVGSKGSLLTSTQAEMSLFGTKKSSSNPTLSTTPDLIHSQSTYQYSGRGNAKWTSTGKKTDSPAKISCSALLELHRHLSPVKTNKDRCPKMDSKTSKVMSKALGDVMDDDSSASLFY